MESHGLFFRVAIVGSFAEPSNAPYDTCRMCTCALALFDLAGTRAGCFAEITYYCLVVLLMVIAPAETPLFCTCCPFPGRNLWPGAIYLVSHDPSVFNWVVTTCYGPLASLFPQRTM